MHARSMSVALETSGSTISTDRSCAFEPRDAFGARTNGGDARAFFVIADLVMIAAFLLELVERSLFGPMERPGGRWPDQPVKLKCPVVC